MGGRKVRHLMLLCVIKSQLHNRVDLRNEQLTVGYPTSIGHEIVTDIFALLSQNGGGYPLQPRGGSTIITGGTSDVRLKNGIKSPDFSLYEKRDVSPTSSHELHHLNSYPTIAWEVAYSEPEKKLSLDAARMICLSHGLIQLVVTINITHTKKRGLEDSDKPKLQKVNCAFWELDIVYSKEIECDDSDDSKVDELVPEPNSGEVSPSAYRAILAAVVPGSKRLQVRAECTETREVTSLHRFSQILMVDHLVIAFPDTGYRRLEYSGSTSLPRPRSRGG